MLRRHLITAAGALAAPSAFAQRGQDTFEVTQSETATLDGRQWDTPMPGGTTMDAVHRSVLLRFPTAADEIADLLRAGRVLVQAELAMTFAGIEIVPEGYLCRDGLGRKLWTENPPSWHVRAWPVRHPWKADKENGPTYNAIVNGKRYWARYGASDPRDRGAEIGDPQELSHYNGEARIDITRLLATAAIEREAGARLRWLEQAGFLVAKLETYDTRYRAPGDAYEWAMPTGGHGLRFAAPRLVLAMRRTASTVAISLPLALRADWEMSQPDGSRPTATMPTPADVAERARRAMQVRGPRPAWEAQRLAELMAAAGDRVSAWGRIKSEADYKAYLGHIKELLSTPPRYWQGWSIQDDLLHWYVFRALLPAPAQDHVRNYWTAWLQPDLPTEAFVHPQSVDAIDYWRRNRDWRGRASFFRGGYNYGVSTQNFNHTAAMGALLGGGAIGAERAIADGRHGLDTLVLRFWAYLDGSTQEMLDHYYVSITLSGQKMIADYGPSALDRLMGRIVLDRTMEMLISAYHSQTRRFIACSGRARLAGVLVEQDGIYGALHTLSKEGTLIHVDAGPEGKAQGLPVWGYDFPPGRVAIQTLEQPWMPGWVASLIDDKPVPFEDTAAETTRGNFKPPLWRRSYQGRWHGLASADVRGGTVDVMAQWVREPRKPTRMEEIGTLTLRYAANDPDLASTHEGHSDEAGLPITFQSRNRAIVFAKPWNNRERFLRAFAKGERDSVQQLATVVGLWNFAETKDWEIYVGGQRITAFPHRSRASDRIVIRDGVSYLALLPIAPTDLGRDAEIEIGPGGAGKTPPTNAVIAPALTISLINLRKPQPVPLSSLDLKGITSRTYGAFVLELGDVHQHGSFEAFQRHIAASTLTTTWRADQNLLEVAYKTGNDLMEASFSTAFGQPSETHFAVDPGQQEKMVPVRRLNGQWPYLAPGLDRDTGWAQQGSTGRLEKNGAVLTGEAGRKAYLICDPKSGGVIAYNPLPDPQAWSLATRDGATFKAEGRVGLLRLEYRPWSHEVFIDHQGGSDTAQRLAIAGLKEAPRVTVNGKRVDVPGSAPDFKVALS
ncbi:MAG: hypothetical protein J0J01_31865 [Reyranella sp.]|uniref:hypothetical protein n=1 Tax=Reyranella sp. TaxID=1929291 RepID=UPI001AC33CE7|nr:hypothetical protein [Reyranella sp.]MBN9091541.1 hypothetical protein [Reyranella sp.]